MLSRINFVGHVIMNCRHCGFIKSDCEKRSRVIGTCQNFNVDVGMHEEQALKEGYKSLFFLRLKPIGHTDEQSKLLKKFA